MSTRLGQLGGRVHADGTTPDRVADHCCPQAETQAVGPGRATTQMLDSWVCDALKTRTLGSLRTTPMRDWRSASTFSAMRCVRYSSYANGRVRATALLYSLRQTGPHVKP